MTTTSSEATTKELVALNADVVGYSKLLADNLAATTSTMEDYHRLVEDKIRAHGGDLVNFVGDNFMCVFEQATDAMATSIAITGAIEERNTDVPNEKRVRFRMGLDQGEVAITNDQYFGDALNIAARIQSIAAPGGVSVSGAVYRALDEPELRFHPMGRQDLKNIPEEVQVYRFADLPSGGGTSGTSRSLALESPSIAVLPIHTEMADDSVAAGAEMIRADLVHRLSQIRHLIVIDASDGQQAETLANYMLETGVVQLGEQIRVFAKLVDIGTWNVAASHKWTASTSDLFSLSDKISEEVANALEIDLIIGEPARIYADMGDPEAIQTIYNAWFDLNTGTQEGWVKAQSAFDSVAESHPDKPYGHTLGALAKWVAVGQGYVQDRERGLKESWDEAQRGIDTGDPTGLAQTVMASILVAQGQPANALETLEGLDIQRPTCDITFAVHGSVRRYLGEWEKAVDLTDTAMRLAAVNNPWYPTIQASSLYMGGRLEEAASTASTVIEFQPNNLEALLILAAAQQEMGMERRARATADLIRDRYPALDVDEWFSENPYQIPELVQRWKSNLRAAGVFDSAEQHN